MKTKLFSLFLALVASVSSMNAYNAYNNLCIDGLYYNLVTFDSEDDNDKIAIVTYASKRSYTDAYTHQTVTVYNENGYTTTAVIPESVVYGGDTYSVTRIGSNAFYGCTGLTSVSIPNSVKEIEDKAFYKCSNLTSVTIPNSVIYLGSDVFWNCSALNTIILSENITNMGNNVFYGCTSLPVIDNIRYADTYLIGAVDKTKTNYTIKDGTKWIGSSAFSGCSNITSFVIPTNILSIGSSVFSGCTNLTTVDISDNIKYIPTKAFASCPNLTSIGNPNSISTIGEEAFSGCTSLVSISFTDSLSQIENKAFQNCKNLESIYLGNSLRILYPYAFWNCSSLNSIVLPNTLYYIDEHVFDGCTNLLSINIPSGLQGFRKDQYKTDYCSVFANCTNLKTVEINSNAIIGTDYTSTYNLSNIFGKQVEKYIIGENVNNIGNFAFYNCENLTSVILQGQMYSRILEEDTYIIDEKGNEILKEAGESFSYWTGIKAIGNNAFSDCSNLQSIEIPNGVTKIGYNAFSGCTNLNTAVLGKKVSDIGNYAFRGSGLNSINIPSSVSKIGLEAFKNCRNLSKVEIEDIASWANIDFADETSNPLYSAKHLYQNDEEIIDLIIPDSVTTIKKYAFINCESLQSVTIPYSVEEFSTTAFSGCNNISSVTINSDVVAGHNYQEGNNMSHVFGEQVKEYVIGDSVSTIGSYAFYECDSIDSFVFGKNVTTIGSHAFYSAGKFSRRLDPLYEEFVLPSKLSSIGAYAFFCWFGLTSLTLPDSMQYLGQAAFGGCQNLAYLSIPASLNSISGEAFFGCTGLKSVTCWATTPPFMGGSDDNVNYHTVFMSVDCDKVSLFVPKESIEEYKTAYQWEEFTHIYPIEYADEINTSEVTAIANEDNSVTVKWPIIEDAVIYTIEIKKNGDLVCTLEFNEEGQLISKVFAMPSRNGNRQTKSATQTANGWQYTIDGLDSGTEYAYTVTAKKADNTEAFTQTITFSTLSHEAIETIETNGGNITKILHDGQIYIIRGDKIYTIQGQEVK